MDRHRTSHLGWLYDAYYYYKPSGPRFIYFLKKKKPYYDKNFNSKSYTSKQNFNIKEL